MTAYRRVSFPRFLFAALQVLLVWVAVFYLAKSTDISFIPTRSLHDMRWQRQLVHGYPIPWIETHEEGEETWVGWSYQTTNRWTKGPEVFGWNPLVPVATLLIVLTGPTLVVSFAGRVLKRELSISRRMRVAGVLFLSSVAGIAVAQVDVLTDQWGWAHIGRVPFQYSPGDWVSSPELGQQVAWLREKRGAMLPQNIWEFPFDHAARNEWTARTRRTAVAMAFGALLATAGVRPWRRTDRTLLM